MVNACRKFTHQNLELTVIYFPLNVKPFLKFSFYNPTDCTKRIRSINGAITLIIAT